MAGALRELLALFQVKVDVEELHKADGHIDSFVKKLGRASEVLAEAFAIHEVKEFFTEQVENAAHLQDLAERLDISAESIKAFGFAAKAAGIDMDTAAHALGFLQKNAGEAMHGGQEQAQAFRALGVSLKDAHGNARPLTDLIDDIAEGFEKLPDQQTRAAYSMKIFGREGKALLPVLAKGKDAMRELFGEADELGSGLGGDFYKNSKKVREEFEHFAFAIASLKERALAAALPYLERLGTWLKDTAKSVVEFTKHTNVLKMAMVFLASIASIKLIGTLTSLARTFGILQPTVLGTARAFLGFAAPIAGIALLYLIFDDLYTLMTGGKSVIGDTLDSLFGVGTAAQFAKDLTEALDATIDVAKDLGTIVKEVLVGALEQAFDAAKSFGTALGDIASGNFKAAWADLQKGGEEMAKDLAKRGGNIADAGFAISEDVTMSASRRKVERNNRRVAAGGPGTMMAPEYGPDTGGTGTREPLPGGGAHAGGEHAPIPGHSSSSSHVEHHTTVQQTNHIKNEIKTPHGRPDEVAKAAAGGTERGIARGNANALASVDHP